MLKPSYFGGFRGSQRKGWVVQLGSSSSPAGWGCVNVSAPCGCLLALPWIPLLLPAGGRGLLFNCRVLAQTLLYRFLGGNCCFWMSLVPVWEHVPARGCFKTWHWLCRSSDCVPKEGQPRLQPPAEGARMGDFPGGIDGSSQHNGAQRMRDVTLPAPAVHFHTFHPSLNPKSVHQGLACSEVWWQLAGSGVTEQGDLTPGCHMQEDQGVGNWFVN